MFLRKPALGVAWLGLHIVGPLIGARVKSPVKGARRAGLKV